MDLTQKSAVTLKKERSYWLDNTKGILITFVVLAHFLSVLYDKSTAMKLIYDFINLFHMPAFMMLSGFFSKRRILEKDYAGTVERFFLPYILYYSVGVLIAGLTGSTTYYNIIQPTYGLWYILVLGIFLIITPLLIDKIGKHIMWVSLLVMAISLAYNPPIYGSLFRVLSYYPFFLAGFFLKPDTLAKFNKNTKTKLFWGILSLILFIVAAFLLYQLSEYDIRDLIWHIKTVKEQMKTISIGMKNLVLLNALSIILAFLCSYAIIFISPRRKTIFSNIGRYSLYVYILHIQIVPFYKFIYNKRRFYIPDSVSIHVDSIIIIIAALVVTYILASEPVRKLTRAFVEPKFNLSFLKKLINKEQQNG